MFFVSIYLSVALLEKKLWVNFYDLRNKVLQKKQSIRFLPRDAMQARPMLSCGVCVCVCVCVYVCVRVSVTFLHSVKTNKPIFKIFSPSGTHTILVFHTKRHDNIPTGIPIECRWGMQKSPFLASIWPHWVLWSVPAASAIDLAATDHGEFITLVAGERPSLLMVGNNDEMYDKKPQRYAEDNVTLRSGKSEA